MLKHPGRTRPNDLRDLPVPSIQDSQRFNRKKEKCNNRAKECLHRLANKKDSIVLLSLALGRSGFWRLCALGFVGGMDCYQVCPSQSLAATKRVLSESQVSGAVVPWGGVCSIMMGVRACPEIPSPHTLPPRGRPLGCESRTPAYACVFSTL